MPVYKFRSFEEAREALWVDEVDDACLKRIADLWAMSEALSPKRYKPGVYRYRSIEEAQADLENLIIKE